MSDIRQTEVRARSTNTFGRVLINARDQHLVVDGPIQNGCPGEAITPAELFLAGVAACGVELLEVLAREQGVPFGSAEVTIVGALDRGKPVRTDVTVFNSVRLSFDLHGVSDDDGAALLEAFKHR